LGKGALAAQIDGIVIPPGNYVARGENAGIGMLPNADKMSDPDSKRKMLRIADDTRNWPDALRSGCGTQTRGT
jgi:hypothetical protein